MALRGKHTGHDVTTSGPRRRNREDALRDYLTCHWAQEGLEDQDVKVKAMQEAATTLSSVTLGHVMFCNGRYLWRLTGPPAQRMLLAGLRGLLLCFIFVACGKTICAQTTESLTWNGSARHYAKYMPSANIVDGLIVLLAPSAGIDGAILMCNSMQMAEVAESTNAIVVCPEASIATAASQKGRRLSKHSKGDSKGDSKEDSSGKGDWSGKDDSKGGSTDSKDSKGGEGKGDWCAENCVPDGAEGCRSRGGEHCDYCDSYCEGKNTDKNMDKEKKDDDGGGHCWKAFQRYGYCNGGEFEDSDDVNFIAAVIEHVQGQFTIPAGKVIVTGHSNGGSMAFRFACEKSEMFGGLVVTGQAWFDPHVGYYDYVNNRIPAGMPKCIPNFKRPFYGVVGKNDNYYGQPGAGPGFEAVANWENYSKQVLGCTGTKTQASRGPSFSQGATTCYEYPSCPSITSPGINRMCSVENMGHESTAMRPMLKLAFLDFFGGDFTWTNRAQSTDPSASASSTFMLLHGVHLLGFAAIWVMLLRSNLQ